MNPRYEMLLAEYIRERDALLEAHPDLLDDYDCLIDTLDGEVEFPDKLAGLIRAAREDEAYAKTLGTMIDEIRERRARLDARAQARRGMVLRLMQAAGLDKLSRPDFTATVARGRPAVHVADPDLLPDELCRIKREPDKTAIKEALEAGRVLPGCALSNAADVLKVHTR